MPVATNTFQTIVFTPPQTVADFMVSEAFFRLIAGPVGSAKTTGCIFELYRRAAEQARGPDGKRRTRFAIVRQTLQQLKQTVLKDILLWLPGIASWKVSDSTIYIESGDIISEWLLIPLENVEDQRRLLSSQLTGAWLSECIEIAADLVPPISGRCGRFPGPMQGGCTWKGIIADTNMPEEGSRWHELMELDTPSDWQIFIQPSGLSEQAENLQWLEQTPETLKLAEGHPDRIARGRMFYERLARNPNPAWVDRYVRAKYGIDPSGSAVFAHTFNKLYHVVPHIEPTYGMLIIGQDFGRDPFAVITQPDNGRLLVLQEVPADDMGLRVHLQRNLRPALSDPRYLGRAVVIVGDPAGNAKDSILETNSFDELKQAGFSCFPAPTNDIDQRIRAVEAFLMMLTAYGPGLIIDGTRCPMLVQALNGGYRYTKAKATFGLQVGENKPKPNKNNWSHVADALQYACLAAQGGTMGAIARKLYGRTRDPNKQTVSSRAWS